MRYVTYPFLFSLFLLLACQTGGKENSDFSAPELNEEELTRVSGLINPSPTSYQQGQTNELIKYALNKNWPVEQTESGLLYWIYEKGNTKKPTARSKVRVHYRGELLDGKIFDESGSNPSSFKLNGMIPAWQEALPMIGEGGKIKILLHSDLGYGGHEISGLIPAYSPLIFEVRLVGVSDD